MFEGVEVFEQDVDSFGGDSYEEGQLDALNWSKGRGPWQGSRGRYRPRYSPCPPALVVPE